MAYYNKDDIRHEWFEAFNIAMESYGLDYDAYDEIANEAVGHVDPDDLAAELASDAVLEEWK